MTRPDDGSDPGSLTAQALDGTRLLVVATGSISVSFLPYWVNWLRIALPGTAVRLVLSATAHRFVSAEALTALLGQPVEVDRWDEDRDPTRGALHVDLAGWADAVLVHPCTFSYLARLATGAGDSPSVLALHATDVPTVLCPALPPGIEQGWAYRRHLEVLADRPNTTVLPPVPARSVTSGDRDAAAPALFPTAIDALALARRDHHGAGAP